MARQKRWRCHERLHGQRTVSNRLKGLVVGLQDRNALETLNQQIDIRAGTLRTSCPTAESPEPLRLQLRDHTRENRRQRWPKLFGQVVQHQLHGSRVGEMACVITRMRGASQRG